MTPKSIRGFVFAAPWKTIAAADATGVAPAPGTSDAAASSLVGRLQARPVRVAGHWVETKQISPR